MRRKAKTFVELERDADARENATPGKVDANRRDSKPLQPKSFRGGSRPRKHPMGPEDDDPRIPTDPIELITEFLRYFQIQTSEDGSEIEDPRLKLSLPVPADVLEELATRFHHFLNANCSLDTAFGGQTGRSRQRQRKTELAWKVAAYIQKHHEAAAKLPRNVRGKSTPFEIAVNNVAEELGLPEETVRHLYKQIAPPWRRRIG